MNHDENSSTTSQIVGVFSKDQMSRGFILRLLPICKSLWPDAGALWALFLLEFLFQLAAVLATQGHRPGRHYTYKIRHYSVKCH